MEPRKNLFFKLLGLALAISGIILNPSVVGKFLTTDGKIEQISFLMIIFAFQTLISAFGLFVFLFPRFFAKYWRLLLLSALGIVLAFAVVESTARVFLDRPAFGWYGYPTGVYIPDITKGDRFTPNFRGYFLNPPYDHIPININSHGLRDVEHEFKKPNGVTRILGIGDSVTFGAGVFLEETYLYRLEKLLQQQGINAEVIKSGVNSYKFDQEYTYYIEEGYKYNPNIVIVGFLDKDIIPVTKQNITNLYESAKRSYRNIQEKDKKSFVEKIRLLCRTCDTLYTLLNLLTNNWNKSQGIANSWNKEWENTSNLEHLEKRMTDLNERLKRNGQQLVIVIFPTTEQFGSGNSQKNKFQDRLKELLKKENIPALDLFPYLNVPEYYRYYFSGDTAHLNAQGHQLVAKIIKEFILKP